MILIVSLMITVIIIFFIVSIIRYHRQYIRLQKERIFAEITMQENERKRIVSDLHDSLGPLLSAVKLNINSIDLQNEEEREIIQKTGRYLDDIISNIRQISQNLLPNTLERKGLLEAMKEFVRQVSTKRNISIELLHEGKFELPKNREVHVFRMLQEITHNTMKHARANHLQILFKSDGQNLFIFTNDDGIGFDLNKTESSGLGLKSLDSRADILGAKLTMESKPGRGTGYCIQIPLPQYEYET